MTDRIMKSLIAAVLGAMALFYVIHNWMNLDSAYGAVAYVLGMEGNEIFPNNLLPAFSPPLAYALAWVIFAFETATGIFCLLGAWKLWSARKADAATFESAKTFARIGAGLAILTWFGIFGTLGGAGYQMWQTEVGSGSLSDAYKFSVWGFLLLIYLALPERETAAP